ncbi:hypothetical protein AVEN_71911-1 [Araneus ventricosus]|uniref:Tc1-like transposase DDE domain-containing protein n=1 Tax=Araneus ventricosus TaxID=182803 RepID=A0A4Y2MNS3_ARAVE|nr:hypothetical protein AVEN_71911-1 [Araneus ventricosus]
MSVYGDRRIHLFLHSYSEIALMLTSGTASCITRLLGRFSSQKKSITANVFLDLLQLFIAPQLEEFRPRIMFQQDGAPPHCGSLVRDFLDETFPDRWIGRDGPTLWPPCSPDITPLDFSF